MNLSLLTPNYMKKGGSSSKKKKASQKRESDNESALSEAESKKKKSRWQGNVHEKAFIPGMPTVLPSNLLKDQEEAYLMQLQIEELSHRLRSNDLGIPPNPEDRSPSPEPVYNNWGKRVNTREARTRKQLEDTRHLLIQKMLRINSDYKPPAEYKPPYVKILSEKLFVPQEENPDINFLGLLIGPRGNTLRAMEKESGARIIVRGKGSVKEGKVNRNDGGPMPGEDEPLHAYITAPSYDSIEKAVEMINAIIHQCVEIPDGQNDWRKKQLRELAVLNGTVREVIANSCTNCGSTAHKSWLCPDRANVTKSVLCPNCGSAGHIAKDCKQRKKFVPSSSQSQNSQKIDQEYMSLMAELGEGYSQAKGGANEYRMQGSTSSFRSLFSNRGEAPRAIVGPQLPGAQGSSNGSNLSSTNDWNQSYSNWYGNQGTSSPSDGADQSQSQNYNQQSYWQNQGQQYQSDQSESRYSQGYQSGFAQAYQALAASHQQSGSPNSYNPRSEHQQYQQQHQQYQQYQQQQQSWMNQASSYGQSPGISSSQSGSHGPYGWDSTGPSHQGGQGSRNGAKGSASEDMGGMFSAYPPPPPS